MMVSTSNVALKQFKDLENKDAVEHADDVYAKDYVPKKHEKNSAEYGRPKPGSLSEARAKEAASNIAAEMQQLCEVIAHYGKPAKDSGKPVISFGELFNIYQYISDKLVGVLLRARKHKMVTFEGEMLFQRRDEKVIITLLLTAQEMKALA